MVKTKVMIVVRDGIVQDVYSTNTNIEITLIDWDNINGNNDPNQWGYEHENNYPHNELTQKLLDETVKQANDRINENVSVMIEQIR